MMFSKIKNLKGVIIEKSALHLVKFQLNLSEQRSFRVLSANQNSITLPRLIPSF